MTRMPRPSFDREAIEAEIDRVRSLGLDALRTLWRVTFRSSPPPAFTKDLMARFLCWHVQEQAFGGLDPETAKHLDGLARGDKPGVDHPRRLKPGTVLLREYQGELSAVEPVSAPPKRKLENRHQRPEPEPAPQEPKCQKLRTRDWGTPA